MRGMIGTRGNDHGQLHAVFFNSLGLTLQPIGRTLVGRTWLERGSGKMCLVCWRFSPASGGHPHQAFSPLRFFRFIAWGLRRPIKGNADRAESIFCNCRTCVGYGPATGPTLKKVLCRTCPVVGRRRNTQVEQSYFSTCINLI